MIASIAFLACLGDECQPVRVRLYEDMTPIYCELHGKQIVTAADIAVQKFNTRGLQARQVEL